MTQWIVSLGHWAPVLLVGLFLGASFLMIWRLDAMSAKGFEGTVLGTLVMPYCSGIGNLIFAILLGQSHGPGREVMINCLVNNVTNLTLLIGLPTVLWGMNIVPGTAISKSRGRKRKPKGGGTEFHINRLSMLLTLVAVLFFSGAVWALGRDGTLNFGDGLVLVGLFLFWQCFHVFEVLKTNARQHRTLGWSLLLNLALLALGGFGVYYSVDQLLSWTSRLPGGLASTKYLGWFTGGLMVLPNAVMAFYYAWKGRPDITYSSQIGDGHICIPLCVGVYALFHPMPVPPVFNTGIAILVAATFLHLLFMTTLGRLPGILGWALIGAYGFFVYRGVLG